MDQRIIFIDAVGLSEYVSKPLSEGGETPLDRVISFTEGAAARPGSQIYWTVDGGTPRTDDLPGTVIPRESWSLTDLLEEMSLHSEAGQTLLFYRADTPFLDTGLTEVLEKRFNRYLADYCFADGYPEGLTPEIIKASLLPLLKEFQQKQPVDWERGFLFSLIQQDINAFDIETELAPRDYRMLRLTLAADNRRNWLLLKRYQEDQPQGSEDILTLIDEKPALQRTLPAAYSLQIVDGCPQSCSYCPYPRMNPSLRESRHHLSREKWQNFMTQIEELSGDAVVSVSLWGEPAFHPDMALLAEDLLKHRGLSLLVETSGIGWSEDVVADLEKRAAALGRRADVRWIVSLDALEEETYRRVRGEGWAEALAGQELLEKYFPGQVYTQAVRMVDNEGHLEEFYRSWKEKKENLIIQKYDWFCGALPQRRVTDLSPLKRNPCWHLKRDMVILLDGRVPLCREDIRGEHLLGDLNRDSLREIWERGASSFQEHLDEKYSGICGECDEYYTYNF